MITSRFLLYRLPFLIYASLILGLSSIPTLPQTGISDKLAHSMEYAVFAFLFWRAIAAGSVRFSWRRPLTVLAGGAAFGAFDEFYQSFVPGRDSSIRDWYADVAGIFVMLTFLLIVLEWQRSG